MDERLIPINGLLALLRGEGGWPALLCEQGFHRHQLEVPISTRLGDVRADVLMYRRSPDLILLCECKGGRNLEEEQLAGTQPRISYQYGARAPSHQSS